MKLSIISFTLLLGLSTISFAQPVPASKVIFVRNLNWFGRSVGYNLFQGDHTKITRIKPHTVAVVEMAAKPTQVWAKTEVKRSLDLNLQANKIYFVECSVGAGILLARPRLKAISLAEFEQLYTRRKYVREQLAQQGYTRLDELTKGYQVQVASTQ